MSKGICEIKPYDLNYWRLEQNKESFEQVKELYGKAGATTKVVRTKEGIPGIQISIKGKISGVVMLGSYIVKIDNVLYVMDGNKFHHFYNVKASGKIILPNARGVKVVDKVNTVKSNKPKKTPNMISYNPKQNDTWLKDMMLADVEEEKERVEMLSIQKEEIPLAEEAVA